MSGRHGNKRRKKKAPPPSAIEVVIEKSRCQEPHDKNTEDDVNEADENGKGFIDLLRDKVFDTAVAAMLISVLALGAYFWQASIMRQTLQVDQRAWVGFDEIKGLTLEEGKQFLITVPVKNAGKTPAIHVAGGLQVVFGTIDHPPDCDAVVANQMGPPAAIMLPDQIVNLRGGSLEQIPATRKEQLKSEATIWVCGKFTYNDIFGFPHWTRYCNLSAPDAFEDNPTGIKFRQCQFYNGIDTESR